MGFYIFLTARVRIRPEHRDFIRTGYLRGGEAAAVPAQWRELFEVWRSLEIEDHFDGYNLTNDGIFEFKIMKKPYYHSGYLIEDYKQFMAKVLLPIADEILFCEIDAEELGLGREEYTEEDVRVWVA